ncbi:MAG: rhomboid family intramembrane serine protease [Deltaproteobacteria bacterium]|nr:rhomboid family intramembrane serine protease [Deltaproteobacteria bacterium]
MIPIKDENPSRSAPIVTVILIVVNVAVYLWQASVGPEEEYGILRWGLTPIELRGLFTYAHGSFSAQPIVTLFSSMFLHGHLLHLAGNMLFLWIFGNNVEDTLGHFRFVLFYLITGVAGALTQVFTTADPTVSMIGASGAISGVLGAYLVLHPFARIVTLVPLFFYFTVVRIPAFFFLIFWFLIQILGGVAAQGAKGGGVAFLAHVGGFVAGIILVRPLARQKIPRAR